MEVGNNFEVHTLVMGVQADLKDLGDKLAKLKDDPEKFQFALAIGLLVVGMLGVKMPLSARIASKKLELVQAEQTAASAERVMVLRRSMDLFEDRLNFSADSSKWQEYLYKAVSVSGVVLPKQSASEPDKIFNIHFVRIPLQVTGTYAQIWKFVDTLERGNRIVRLENFNLTADEGALVLKCDLLGISRPRSESEDEDSMWMDDEESNPPSDVEPAFEEDDFA